MIRWLPWRRQRKVLDRQSEPDWTCPLGCGDEIQVVTHCFPDAQIRSFEVAHVAVHCMVWEADTARKLDAWDTFLNPARTDGVERYVGRLASLLWEAYGDGPNALSKELKRAARGRGNVDRIHRALSQVHRPQLLATGPPRVLTPQAVLATRSPRPHWDAYRGLRIAGAALLTLPHHNASKRLALLLQHTAERHLDLTEPEYAELAVLAFAPDWMRGKVPTKVADAAMAAWLVGEYRFARDLVEGCR